MLIFFTLFDRRCYYSDALLIRRLLNKHHLMLSFFLDNFHYSVTIFKPFKPVF